MGVEGGLWNYGERPEAYPIDTGRLANVLTLASDAAGWGQELPDGEAIGLAVHRSFVTYVAAAARVKVVDGTITRAGDRHGHRLRLRRSTPSASAARSRARRSWA